MISGHTNYLLGEHVEFSRWKQAVAEAYKVYGFLPFESRLVERATDLEKKGGLAKEIYAIKPYHKDSGYKEKSLESSTLCLPFDHTVPFALFLANNPDTKLPLRRQDLGYSWRVEKPEPGRFNAFVQADVDIIDRNLNVFAEMECILAIVKALEALKIPPITVYLNDIGIAKGLVTKMGFDTDEKKEQALKVVDKLDKMSFEEAVSEIMALEPAEGKSTVSSLVEVFKYKGNMEKFVKMYQKDSRFGSEFMEQINTLRELVGLLEASEVDPSILQFCPGMVRGLDYYTGVVFETYLNDAPHRGSIASGGRYNNLVSAVANESQAKALADIQGFGGSIGLTRLFDVTMREGMVDVRLKTSSKVMICQRKVRDAAEKKALTGKAIQLAGRVRALKIPTELYTNSSHRTGKQLGYADDKGIPVVVMVMSEGSFVIKKMYDSTQSDVDTVDKVVSHIEKMFE